MPPRAVAPLVAPARRLLRLGASRSSRVRRLYDVVARELRQAADDVYGGEYYGEGRDPASRGGISGYERYDRKSSNADIAAYLIWRNFPVARSLDVGCATGFVVEALRELGVDAEGVDISRWAVDHPAPGARGHIQWGDLLEGLPFPDASFDVVSVLETLEHLPPDDIPKALLELRRVCGAYLFATIPSFGPNPNGPGGWLNAKVRDEVLDRYQAMGDSYDGPVPYDDLFRDARGAPIEGHLTIASFTWWTERFQEAGFVRSRVVEARVHPDLARFGLTKFWNLYVFRVPGVDDPPDAVRSEGDWRAVEARWGLDAREGSPEDLEAVTRALGGSGAPF